MMESPLAHFGLPFFQSTCLTKEVKFLTPFLMNKLKVLHVLSLVGGVEICLRQILKNIDENKFSSVLVTQPLNEKPPIEVKSKKNLQHYYAPIYREINLFYDVVAVIKTIYIIIKEKPKLIHAHSSKAGVIARAAALFFSIPVIYTPHAFSFLSTNKKNKKDFYILIEKIFKNKNVNILATSESEKNRAIEIIGYDPDKVKVIKNSIPFPKVNIAKSSYINHSNYICTVGRPSFQKNIKMLIRVFSLLKNDHKNLHLYIVGAGEYSPNVKEVKKLINSLGLDNRVTIIPWIDREEVAMIIKNCKLYVSTSRYEGLPYAVLESLSLKKACVLTDCDGNRELVIDNKSGYLIRGNNVRVMSKKISDLLLDEEKCLKFGDEAFKFFKDNHSFDEYIQNLQSYYLKLSK